MSSKSKGKVYENEIVNELKDVFPNCHRNWIGQSAQGGVDLANTGCFDIEVKGGRQANIVRVRKWLDQVEEEGKRENFNVVVARPLREEKYVLMPWDDFKELLGVLKREGIL